MIGTRILKGNQIGAAASGTVRKAMADQAAQSLAPLIAEAKQAGCVSATAIARHLNQRGIPAPRGGRWLGVQVKRILHRLAG